MLIVLTDPYYLPRNPDFFAVLRFKTFTSPFLSTLNYFFSVCENNVLLLKSHSVLEANNYQPT